MASIAFGLAVLSCGKDVTGPGGSVSRYARGLSWSAMFPVAFQALGGTGSSVVPFSRVHVQLLHSDGTVALDTVLDFPSGAPSITLNLSVPLLASAPADGEPMTLTLSYLNGSGSTMFQGGPVTVVIAPALPGGGGNPPIQIPVRYTGPGYNAATVAIAPRGTSVQSGSSFSFSAVANDSAGHVIPNTPIVWTSLDPAIANVTAMTAGAGLAGLQRGSARIVAQLLTGPADTVLLNVMLPASQLISQAGNGQAGSVGAPLGQPLVAKVAASDGVGVAGVTVTFAVATGAGSVTNASVVSDANGLAQTTWTLGPAAGMQSVTASAGTLTNSPLTFSALAAAAGSAKLVVTTPPSNGTAGAALAPIRVTAEDNNGNIATTFTGPVTLTLGASPPGATLGGTLTVNAVGGVATFNGISLNKASTGYTLIASSGTLKPVTTTAFDISAAASAALEFSVAPAGGTVAGVAITPALAVTAVDAFGNATPSFTGTVTLGFAANPTGASFGGTVTASAAAGVATFPNVSVSRAGVGYVLTAAAAGLTSATSPPFDVAGGAATQLAVTTQPAGGTAGAALAPVRLTAKDINGDVATSFNGPVTLAFGANPSGATLGGTLTVNAVAGVATFSTLTVDKTGTGYTLKGSSAGLTGTATTPFDIGAAASTTLLFTVAPAASTVAGTAFAPALVVTAEDALGNVTTSFTGTVTLGFGANPTGASLGGTVAVSAVAGVATFANVFVPRAGSGYTLTASATGLTSATSPAFAITAGSAAQFVVSAQPASGTAGIALAPIGVTAEDGFGNVATTFTGPVTLALNANPGGSTLAGTLTVSAAAGIATFSDISLNKAANGYALSASSGALTPATTNAFSISAGLASQLVVSAQPAGGTAGIALAPIGFTAEDSFGNVVTTFTGPVTLALGANPGGSTLAGTLTVAAVGGIATFGDISLNKATSGYTLTASSGTLTTATTSSFNIVAGPAVSIAISGGNNQTARVNRALTTPLSVIVRDIGGNAVAGVTVQFAVLTGGGGVTVAAAVSGSNGIASTSWTLGSTVGTQTVSATVTGLTGSPLTFSATAQSGER